MFRNNNIKYFRELLLEYIDTYYCLPKVVKNNIINTLLPNDSNISLLCIEYSNNSLKLMLDFNTINVTNYINKKYKNYLAN